MSEHVIKNDYFVTRIDDDTRRLKFDDGVTEHGEWFVQNGPQRAYVTPVRAPFIVPLDGSGAWQTHTGLEVLQTLEALIDVEGNAYIVNEYGLAGIDDRDLLSLLNSLEVNYGPTEAAAVTVGDRWLSLSPVDANSLPARFSSVLQPGAASD